MKIATVVGAMALGLPLLVDAVGPTFETAEVPQRLSEEGRVGAP